MEMAKPTQLAKAPAGSTIATLPNGNEYIRYPETGVRETWTPPTPTVCPTCGRALNSATVEEAMAI